MSVNTRSFTNLLNLFLPLSAKIAFLLNIQRRQNFHQYLRDEVECKGCQIEEWKIAAERSV